MSDDRGLDIIAENDSFFVINKPGGLLSIPGRTPDLFDSVSTRLIAMFPDTINQPSVHRLDMDTSGVMVFARTEESHRNLSKQFRDHTVQKKYIALLDGRVEESEGKVELSFRLDIENRPHQIYDAQFGKTGITHWRRIGYEAGYTRVEFVPVTGRTHQLRLHASHNLGLGCPLVGDRLYSGKDVSGRLCLHAFYLAFNDPRIGKKVEFSSSVPF